MHSTFANKFLNDLFIFRYRYSLDELPPILHKLKLRAEAFDTWSEKVRSVLETKAEKLTLQDLKVIVIADHIP